MRRQLFNTCVKITPVSSNSAVLSPTSNATIEAASWNDFVAASPYGDVLQCLEWGELKKPDWQPVPVSLGKSGHIEAAALVLRRGLPRTGKSILYAPRGPILDWSQPERAHDLLTRLKATAAEQRAVLLKVDPAVPKETPGVAQTLQSLGFVPSPDANNSFGGTQPRFNMKLDIAGSEKDVQDRFHQKWRYNIRLAERKGVRVEESTSRADVAVFHEIYRVTAQRDGFTGRPLKYFEKLWDVLVEKDLARFFVTYYEGQPLSAAICFVLGRQCWYVYGASSNEHRKVMPNHAMQWAMIQWARARGCTIYDFRGVHDVPKNPDNPGDVSSITMDQLMESPDGLVRFKAGFGARLIEYVGEWDLPLNKSWYWLWTTARPKLVDAMKKARKT
jgi:lipid II:glycine glycyltransferase (peptidoglycan interpeptide bridge formation enzyme)